MRGFSIVDIPRSGAQNMAVDEQLLQVAAERHVVVLRAYLWSRPTLSLGYFQQVADRSLNVESQDIELVRRSTGGGAIVHHHDWTYSLAVPDELLESSVGSSQSMYDGIHQAVIDWLAEYGLEASQLPKSAVAKTKHPPFLCFERRSLGDVILSDCKIMGSAQRRSRGALLQHGSLLLRRSEFAPTLPGIADLHPARTELVDNEQLKRPESPANAPSTRRIRSREDALSSIDHSPGRESPTRQNHAATGESELLNHQQVCHIAGMDLVDFLARLSARIIYLFGISVSNLPSVEALDVDPNKLGKYAESSWLHRR